MPPNPRHHTPRICKLDASGHETKRWPGWPTAGRSHGQQCATGRRQRRDEGLLATVPIAERPTVTVRLLETKIARSSFGDPLSAMDDALADTVASCPTKRGTHD